MASYTNGFKSRMVQRLAGPERISANALSKETGVSPATLSRWVENERKLIGMSKSKNNGLKKPGRRSAEDKLRIVMASASISAEELGAFLRIEGIHEAQLLEWRAQVTQAATGALKDAHRSKAERSPQARRIRELESELRRKEKALAEAAALLILQKKLKEFYQDQDQDEDPDTSTRSAI